MAHRRRVEILSRGSQDHFQGVFRGFFGALRRRAPHLIKGDAFTCFTREAIEVFHNDAAERAPKKAAKRMVALKSALERIAPDPKWSGMFKDIAASQSTATKPLEKSKHEGGRGFHALEQDIALLDVICDDGIAVDRGKKILRKTSKDQIKEIYAAYMGSVARRAPDLLDSDPADRFTREAVELVILDQKATCDDATIAKRLRILKRALGRAQLQSDYTHLSTRARLLMRFRQRAAKTFILADLKQLLKFGYDLMDDVGKRLEILGDVETLCSKRLLATRYRDGLMIVILGLLAPRLHNLAALSIGTTIKRKEPSKLSKEVEKRGWKYGFTADGEKNGVIDWKNIPEDLTPYIEFYVGTIRKLIWPGAPDEAFWVSNWGCHLSESGIQKIIPIVSRKASGVAASTHDYRYFVATLASQYVEVDPELASKLLNHLCATVTEAVYIKASRAKTQAVLASLVGAALSQAFAATLD